MSSSADDRNGNHDRVLFVLVIMTVPVFMLVTISMFILYSWSIGVLGLEGLFGLISAGVVSTLGPEVKN